MILPTRGTMKISVQKARDLFCGIGKLFKVFILPCANKTQQIKKIEIVIFSKKL